MNCRLDDWGSIPHMMGYFPFATMFFLALVFTQRHYNSKAQEGMKLNMAT
jgi:hypothetical protein